MKVCELCGREEATHYKEVQEDFGYLCAECYVEQYTECTTCGMILAYDDAHEECDEYLCDACYEGYREENDDDDDEEFDEYECSNYNF